MSFLNPWAFLLLLAVPVLVLLYFLKLKRPQVRVPSTLLWQKVLEDMRVNSPFQRLRRSLLLILQLLALLAVIFALTRPIKLVRDNVSESLIVLVDNSASMGAAERGKTRLQDAKDKVAALADGLAADSEMMVVVFNNRARIVCPFDTNKRRLREAVSSIQPTECPTDIQPALLLSKSLAASRGSPRILIFSDGAFPPPETVKMPPGAELAYQAVGANAPNLAITRLDVRRSLNDRNRVEMFVVLENFSPRPFSGNMAVFMDDRMLDSKFVEVKAGETLSQIFEALLPGGGCVRVELDAKDALAADNRAWRIVPPPSVRRVMLVGESTYFIERVFKATRDVVTVCVAAGEYDEKTAESCAAVIWSAVNSPATAPCDNIYLGCFPKIDGLVKGAKVDAPDILDWNNTHPANRFIDYDNLLIASAFSMTLPDTATELLRSSRTPLIAMMEHGGRAVCIVGFDPMQSNWPLLVSYPVFLRNCLDYFDQRNIQRTVNNIQVGGTITVQGGGRAPEVLAPWGAKAAMTRNAGGDHAFSGVTQCGIYRINDGEGAERIVAANLFDSFESRLDAVAEPALGGSEAKKAVASRKTNREYWRALAMILGAVLLVEWVVYHRRLLS